MNFRSLTGIIFLFLAVTIPASSQDSLSLLSWNIQMLPRIVKNNGNAKRAKAIVHQLNQRNYDVVAFQELFHKRARRIIRKGLIQKYPYHTPVLNQKIIAFKTNGGVMIFSRYPITEIHEIRYKDRTGFDRLSRKGAIMAEINVNEKHYQIVATHLQAFGVEKVMYSQYDQLAKELLAPNAKPGVPQLICGDFNTLKTLPPQLPADVSQTFIARLARYGTLLQTLDASDGELSGEQQFTMDRPFNDMCVTRKEYRLLLDYVFLKPNGLTNYSINRKVQIIRERWSREHQDLSDHFALKAVFQPKAKGQ